MTMKQKAIAALIGLLGAGGGSTVGAPALRSLLTATCHVSEERATQTVPGGSETKITIKQAANLIGQLCDENASPLVDKIELKLTHPAAGPPAMPPPPPRPKEG